MSFFISFSDFIIEAADYLWNGPVLVTLLLGGGIYFSLRSRLIPLLFFKSAFRLLRKKRNSDKGISPYESVSSQIAGMGTMPAHTVTAIGEHGHATLLPFLMKPSMQ